MTDNDCKILARLRGDMKRIAELIGIENAFKLSQEWGGGEVYIHKLDELKREVRNASIRCDFDEKKMTVRELARKHNLTDRQIYTILSTQPEEDKTLSIPFLF